MSLRTTIRQIQARDSDTAAISADKEAFLKQWIEDLKSLYSTIESELKEFVEDGLLVFQSINFNVSEEALGEYLAPGMRLKAASKEVYLAPAARLTSGGAGRVDFYRSDRPSESDRILIVRRVGEDGSLIWSIEDKGAEKTNTLSLENFVPQYLRAPKKYTSVWSFSLEKALDFLLSQ